MSGELIVADDAGVRTLTLNRPERLNALTHSLMADLADAVADAARDAAVGCVVLTGAGRGFCSGGDTRAGAQDRGALPATAPPQSRIERSTDRLRREMEAARLLHIMPKPTIALINGPVAGAGIGLAGACDFRFAARSATFTSAFLRIGASGDYGSSWFWTHILGTAKARELFMLGDQYEADEALAFGLYHRVFPDHEVQAQTLAIARRLADGPRAAWRYMKANLNGALTGTLEDALDREAVNMVLSITAHFAGKPKPPAP